jgi:hypothetical protein
MKIKNESGKITITFSFKPLLLSLILLVLRLTGVIGWSYWWIFSPIIAQSAYIFLVYLIVVIVWTIKKS